MTRESLEFEPVLDEEIVEQNLELMDERFPEIIVDEWTANTVPLITELIDGHKAMDDQELRQKAHKGAGSTVQLVEHQLGTALRIVSLPGFLRKFDMISRSCETACCSAMMLRSDHHRVRLGFSARRRSSRWFRRSRKSESSRHLDNLQYPRNVFGPR